MIRVAKLPRHSSQKRNFFRNFFRSFPTEVIGDDNLQKSPQGNLVGLFGIKNLLTPQDFQKQSLQSLQNCRRLQNKVLKFSLVDMCPLSPSSSRLFRLISLDLFPSCHSREFPINFRTS
jgi:hypothetical protein